MNSRFAKPFLIALAIVLTVMFAFTALFSAEKLKKLDYVNTGFSNQLHPQTIRSIEDYSQRYPFIGAISLIGFDFQKNTRLPVFTIIPNAQIKEIVSKYPAGADIAPIFTSDKKQNDAMSALLNGEFACVGSKAGAFSRIFKLQDILTTSCRIPILPASGRMIGYLAVHLTKTPTPAELKQIEADTKTIAASIYYGEVVP